MAERVSYELYQSVQKERDALIRALARLLVDIEYAAGMKGDRPSLEAGTAAVREKLGELMADSYRHARQALGDDASQAGE